jgi:hypothetical protein
LPASKLFALDGSKGADVIYRTSDSAWLKDMIRQLIVQSGSASRSEINRLLLGHLPSSLTKVQRQNRINTLLATMRAGGIIESIGPNQKAAVWKLKGPISTNHLQR